MKVYQIGETVTCKAAIKRSAALYDPVDSVVIYIYIKGTTAALINGVAMTKESTGVYTYDYQTTSCTAGEYRWRVVADDGTKIAKKDSAFKLEA